jgi:heme-degrading monooxygenase HmoA
MNRRFYRQRSRGEFIPGAWENGGMTGDEYSSSTTAVGFLRLWSYAVKPAQIDAFIRIYGSDGEWARLFAKEEGYLGTELWRAGENKFITLDRWRSEADWHRFKAEFAAEYAALDERCAGLTETETDLGEFTLS